MKVFIKTLTNQTIVLEDVKDLDTVENIKFKIQQKEGHPENQQSLIYSDIKLEDRKTLNYYNIQRESTLYLIINSREHFQIFVKTLYGKTITLDVKHSTRIEEIKGMVNEKEAIPPKNIILIFSGNELRSGKLEQFGIQMEQLFISM